jgi:hypothetical protein
VPALLDRQLKFEACERRTGLSPLAGFVLHHLQERDFSVASEGLP